MSFTEDYYYQEKFSKLALTREKIKSRAFEECEFTGCSFIDCQFEKSKFINCKFSECILSAIIPMNCRFLEVQFNNCKVIGIDWTKSTEIRELHFSECQVSYSNFKLMKVPQDQDGQLRS